MATEGNATTANTMNSVLGMVNSAKQKWDSSGANEAIGRLQENIPQSTRDYVSTTSSQIFSRRQLRPISILFGIGEERPFYFEKAPSLLVARLQHNLTFFLMNYIIITGVMFCLTLLSSPMTLVGIGLVVAAWFYVLRQAQDGQIALGSMLISQRYATIGMGLVSTFVLWKLLGNAIWWTVFSSAFVILGHAGMRDASMHQDTEDKMDMVGEVGEDASFLGADRNVV